MSSDTPSTNDQPTQDSERHSRPQDGPAPGTEAAASAQDQQSSAGSQPPPASADAPAEGNPVDVAIQEPAEANEQPVQVNQQFATATGQPPAWRRSALNWSPNTKKLLTFLLLVAVLGVAAYMIAPRRARSDVVQQSKLAATETKLKAAGIAESKLRGQLKAAQAELAEMTKQAEAAAAAHKDASAKVTAAEESVAQLSQELEQAKTANKPMEQKLAAAQKQASERQAQATQATAKADQLQDQLADATKQRDQYAATGKQLQTDKAKLQDDLTSQRKVDAELLRLLEALDLGQAPQPPAQPKAPVPAPLPEMPLTIEELICSMGQPKLTIQAGKELTLHWGKEHSARAIDGVAVSIDEKPASRALLAAAAAGSPAVAQPPAPWRMGKNDPLYYADLVAMFGRPERLAGTGRRFTAWWSIGAWARKASATVADGVVMEFDGRQVEPAQICALVYHRAEAYGGGASSAWAARVQANVASAKACYQYVAETLLAQQLRQEAELRARDGLTLTECSLAPFDSVGTWIAPANAPPGSIALRAAVDCTWTAMDGTATTEQRYLAVSLVKDQGDLRPTDCAIFAPRD